MSPQPLDVTFSHKERNRRALAILITPVDNGGSQHGGPMQSSLTLNSLPRASRVPCCCAPLPHKQRSHCCLRPLPGGGPVSPTRPRLHSRSASAHTFDTSTTTAAGVSVPQSQALVILCPQALDFNSVRAHTLDTDAASSECACVFNLRSYSCPAGSELLDAPCAFHAPSCMPLLAQVPQILLMK